MADLETRQVNSLYRRINNEAVDEDKQANRRAVEFSKKQAKLFSPDKKQAAVLSKKDLDSLKKLLSKFTTTLNKYTVAYSKRVNIDEIKDISSIQGQYDIICLFLSGINLSALDKPDYDNVIGELDKLLPKLGEVKRLIYAVQGEFDETIFEKRVIDHILTNFKNHQYEPFGSYTNEDVVEVGRLIGEERVQKIRDNVDAFQEREDDDDVNLDDYAQVQQLPIGVPIPDQDIIDELEQDKVTLTGIFGVLVDYANTATPALRRSINQRIQQIQGIITTIDNAIDGSIQITGDLLDNIQKIVSQMEDFRNFLLRNN